MKLIMKGPFRQEVPPIVQRQSKATIIAQEADLRDKYHDALSRLSDVVAQRRELVECLHWIAEHQKEFGDIEDNEKMLFEIQQKASLLVTKYILK